MEHLYYRGTRRKKKEKEIEILIKSYPELKNTLSEMKYTMEGFKSRLDDAEETVNEIEIRE